MCTRIHCCFCIIDAQASSAPWIIVGVVVSAAIVATGNMHCIIIHTSLTASLPPTVVASIAVTLLFGATGLVVGVVICTKRLRSKSSAANEPSGAQPVGEPVYEDMRAGSGTDAIPEPIPEYEEISLKETKLADIQLTDNAAYGVGLK